MLNWINRCFFAFLVYVCMNVSVAGAGNIADPHGIVEYASRATVMVKSEMYRLARGTAFCIHPSGYFISNFHVVIGLDEVVLVLNAGTPEERSIWASVIRTDKKHDLALLRAKKKGIYSAIDLAKPAKLKKGMKLMAFGFPESFSDNRDASSPSVSVCRGSIVMLDAGDEMKGHIKTDANLYSGNSGGAVLDERGKFIGVVVSGIPGRGVGFVIPLSIMSGLIKEPDISLEYPMIQVAEKSKPVDFKVRVVFPGRMVTSLVSVNLNLTQEGVVARDFNLKKVAADVYSASVVPVPVSVGQAPAQQPGAEEGLRYVLQVKDAGKVVAREEGAVYFLSLTRGLVAYWKFQEGQGVMVRDFSGHENHLVLKGNPRWVPGVQDQALEFDGKDDSLIMPDLSRQWPNKDVSMAFWVKEALDKSKIGVGRGSFHAMMASLHVWFNEAGKLNVRFNGERTLKSSKSLSNGKWHNVVFTCAVANGRLRMYVDGVFEGSIKIINVYGGENEGLVNWFSWIGESQKTPSRSGLFRGQLDEMCIYNRVLLDGEIKMMVAMKKATGNEALKALPPDVR